MALLKPTMLLVPAFDATKDNVFYFTVPSGGDQVVKNRLTIINQATGQQVYQQDFVTFSLNQTVLANTLSNNGYYTGYFNTYNAQGQMSPDSNIVAFYCYTTPSYSFTNMPSGNIITNSNFNFQVTYNQVEGELLDSYIFNLYDAQKVLVATSQTLYVGSTTPPPTILSHTFGGLTDQTSFFIESKGKTVQNTEITTGLVGFTTKYTKPNVFAIVELTQNCREGYVTVKSNLTNIEGKSNPSPPIYVDANTAVDLRGDGTWVTWDSGYHLIGDIDVEIWGRAFNPNKNIVTFQNAEGDSITIRYCQGYNDNSTILQTYVDCTVVKGTIINYIYSNYIDNPLDTNKIQIVFKRINNVYQIAIYNLG